LLMSFMMVVNVADVVVRSMFAATGVEAPFMMSMVPPTLSPAWATVSEPRLPLAPAAMLNVDELTRAAVVMP